MNNQRLRNLTTGRLHTEIGHVYEDLESIIGETGLFTHMLPNMCLAVEPWLREQVTDPRFWDGKYDPSHKRFAAMQNPLEDKHVVVVVVE